MTHDAPSQSATAGSAFTGAEGYWLFVTRPATLDGADEAATAPLWTTIGGSTSKLYEKTAIPTVTKQVKEDSTGAWGTAADAHRKQEVSYRLVGTLPSNFAAFEHYHYRFDDRLSDGLELALATGADPASALTIKVGDKVVAADGVNLTVTWADQHLCIDFSDLANAHWRDLGIDAHTTITVDYRARLTPAAITGSPGNDNDVTVTYSNDPLGNGEGVTTPPPTPRLFTYALKLVKLDEQTGEALPGAGFTIRAADTEAEEGSHALYVQQDGSLGTEPHEFVTAQDGTFTVNGIDEGTFVISETTAPEGYERIGQDITATLTSLLGSTPASLEGLSVKVDGGEQLASKASEASSAPTADTASGVATISVTNDKIIGLPITGQAGLRGGGVGLVVASICTVLLLARRRPATRPSRR